MASSPPFTSTKLQVGLKSHPCTVITVGGEHDAGKKTVYCKVLLDSQANIDAIQRLEKDVFETYPRFAHSSSLWGVGEHKEGEPLIAGQTTCNVKISRGDRVFACDRANPKTVDNINDLVGGHKVLLMVTPRAWEYNQKCGVTLYANQVYCVDLDTDFVPPERVGADPDAMEWS